VEQQRLQWLQQWADGADGAALLQLSPADVDAVARLGAAALVGKQLPRAHKIFEGLCALQPAVMTHRLHLACVHAAMGNHAAARANLDIVVDANPSDTRLLSEALHMRAELRAKDDREGARADLGAARKVAANASPRAGGR
jgi:hypothetical protein